MLRDREQLAESERFYRRSLSLADKLAARAKAPATHRVEASLTHSGLGLLLERAGRWAEAEQSLRRALALQDAVVRDNPRAAIAHTERGPHAGRAGPHAPRPGPPRRGGAAPGGGASPARSEAARLLPKNVGYARQAGRHYADLAETRLLQGRHAAAAADAARVCPACPTPRPSSAAQILARCVELAANDDAAAAQAYGDEAVRRLRGVVAAGYTTPPPCATTPPSPRCAAAPTSRSLTAPPPDE